MPGEAAQIPCRVISKIPIHCDQGILAPSDSVDTFLMIPDSLLQLNSFSQTRVMVTNISQKPVVLGVNTLIGELAEALMVCAIDSEARNPENSSAEREPFDVLGKFSIDPG